MSDLLTGWEQTGSWSSLAEESAYVHALAAQTDVELSIAGYSVLGQPAWRLELGNPSGPAMMVVAGIHGTELSGREASVIWLRELAQSTDPAVQAYLAAHRIVVIPNASPDTCGMGSRLNANGVEMNRDYARLSQPEPRNVRRVIKEVQPQIILDLHEVDAALDGGADWRPYPGGHPESHPLVQAAAEACLGQARTAAQTDGFTVLDYLRVNLPVAGASTIAGAFHAVGILSEPSMRIPREGRVEVSKILMRAVMEWHRDHQTELASAIAASKAAAVAGGDTIQIATGPRLPDMSEVPCPDWFDIPAGFEFPAELAELHGIEITEREPGVRSASTHQEARWLVAALLHPDSFDYLPDAGAWTPTPPPPTPAVADYGPVFRVRQGGVIRRVREIWVRQGGVRRRVTAAYVRQGGVRRRL